MLFFSLLVLSFIPAIKEKLCFVRSVRGLKVFAIIQCIMLVGSDIELPENSQAACNYARWERTSEEGISFVQLSAQTFDNSSQFNPSLGIYIDIGQTIPSISIGDLMSYLPNAELENAAK